MVLRARHRRGSTIVTDNGSCYRANEFGRVMLGARHQWITPYTPRHNGKVERYNRILAEEFLYSRAWSSRPTARSIENLEPALQLLQVCEAGVLVVGDPLVALVALRDRHVSGRIMCCHTVIGDLHAIGMDTARIILGETAGERV